MNIGPEVIVTEILRMLSDVFQAILCFLDLIVFLLPCTSVSILTTLIACVYVI